MVFTKLEESEGWWLMVSYFHVVFESFCESLAIFGSIPASALNPCSQSQVFFLFPDGDFVSPPRWAYVTLGWEPLINLMRHSSTKMHIFVPHTACNTCIDLPQTTIFLFVLFPKQYYQIKYISIQCRRFSFFWGGWGGGECKLVKRRVLKPYKTTW